MEIAAMTRANLDTQNLLITKTTPSQTMNDHITTDHTFRNTVRRNTRELARLRAPPPTRSRKSNHKLEPRYH
jgi:hypothetical protein